MSAHEGGAIPCLPVRGGRKQRARSPWPPMRRGGRAPVGEPPPPTHPVGRAACGRGAQPKTEGLAERRSEGEVDLAWASPRARPAPTVPPAPITPGLPPMRPPTCGAAALPHHVRLRTLKHSSSASQLQAPPKTAPEHCTLPYPLRKRVLIVCMRGGGGRHPARAPAGSTPAQMCTAGSTPAQMCAARPALHRRSCRTSTPTTASRPLRCKPRSTPGC